MSIQEIILLALLIFAFWIFFVRQFIFRLRKFGCMRCGRCCRLRVKLSREDIEILKKAGKKNFVEKGNWLRRINGYCEFLEIKNGYAKCSVYNSRPGICRWWPVKKFRVDTRCRCFDRKVI